MEKNVEAASLHQRGEKKKIHIYTIYTQAQHIIKQEILTSSLIDKPFKVSRLWLWILKVMHSPQIANCPWVAQCFA